MSHTRIHTKDSLKQWILRKLGQPLVDIILEHAGCGCTGVVGLTGNAVTQLDDAIDDAIEKFQFLAGGEGHERRIMLVPLKAGMSTYDIPEGVISVKDTLDLGMGSGVNTLFTLSNSLFGNGNWPLRGAYGGGGEVVDYTLATQWLRTFDSIVGVDFVINHRAHENVIDIYPTPTHDAILPMEIYIITPDEKLYNNIWVREYALALSNIQVGYNTGSMTGIQFPMGGEFNYSMYLERGNESIEKLMEEMKTDTYGEPIDFFIT